MKLSFLEWANSGIACPTKEQANEVFISVRFEESDYNPPALSKDGFSVLYQFEADKMTLLHEGFDCDYALYPVEMEQVKTFFKTLTFMKHTKGEWLLQEPGLYGNRRRVNISETNNPENDLTTILVIEDYTDNKEVAKANAKLIAAAPNLLDAVIAINGYWESGNFSREPELWEKFKAAIKKATL